MNELFNSKVEMIEKGSGLDMRQYHGNDKSRA
jgi:hypothetical protein